MGKDSRYTLRKRSPYNTASNKRKVVKTPGHRLSVQYLKKRVSAPKCGDCDLKLQGIPAYRPQKLHSLSKNKKTVTRAYGGSRCHRCVKDRILRSFLLEEHANVKSVVKSNLAAAPAATKPVVAKAEAPAGGKKAAAGSKDAVKPAGKKSASGGNKKPAPK